MHLRPTRAALPVALLLCPTLSAQLQPEWTQVVPLGASLSSSYADSVVDPSGTTYLTATEQAGNQTDVTTLAVSPAGAVLWQSHFDGAAGKSDQARAIALAPDGSLWVAGSTQAANFVADVLLLRYEPAAGTLLSSVQIPSIYSESALDLAIAPTGELFAVGTTVGDGSDVLVRGFDPLGAEQWSVTWDGSAWGPFSQDVPRQITVDPNGDVLVLVNGIMGGSLPDYVVLKLDPQTGATLWQATWGPNGNEAPREMAVDAAGDVYVTGSAVDVVDKYGTIKLDGATGALLWEAYDAIGFDHAPAGLELDGAGGVYVTGTADPDGDDSNFNDDFFTVKRSTSTGGLQWTHHFGDPCVGCFDAPSDLLHDPVEDALIVAGTTASAPHGSAQLTLVLDASTGGLRQSSAIAGAPGTIPGSGTLGFDATRAWTNSASRTDWNTGAVDLTVVKHAPLQPPCGAVATVSAVADAGGLNVAGGLAHVGPSGLPTLGNQQFALAVDDPTGACGLGPNALTFVFVSRTASSAIVPGLGCAAGGPGEVMIGLAPPLAAFGPVAWTAPGQAAQHVLPIPGDPGLCGYQAFAQALLVDPSALAGQRLHVTNRVDVVLGS